MKPTIWTPDSWKNFTKNQMPTYPDAAKLKTVEDTLAS